MAEYGLIGYPLGHSFSQKYFNHRFSGDCKGNSYSLFPLQSLDDFEKLIQEHSELKGLNVTIPYKRDIFNICDVISPAAAKIGAVNCIKIDRGDGLKISGFNTDYIGFMQSLKPLLCADVKKALILGTGGASRAIAYALDLLGIEYIKVSRNKSGNPDIIQYSEITPELMSNHNLIVNTTPLGMYPHVDTAPDIPYSYLTPRHIVYDLVYNPEQTRFMTLAAEQGPTVKNGLEMLQLQAEESYRIWGF